MRKIIIISAIAVGLNSVCMAETIATATKATAKINAACTFSMADVGFGDLTANVSPTLVWATGTVQATCTRGTAFNVQIGNGKYFNTNYYRRMNGNASGAKILYTVCKTQKNIAGTWGNTGVGCADALRDGATTPITATGTGSNQLVSFYLLSSTGFYTPDSFSDTNTVKITY